MRKIVILSIIMLGLFSSIPWIQALDDYEYKGLSLNMYADGVAHVEYRVDVNPTLARINVTTLGTQIRNLVVKDQEGDLLDSIIVNGHILVKVLGSKSIYIKYATPDLTKKDRAMWTLQSSLPIESDVRLPEGATILSLDPIPLGISIVGESTTLTMPPGNVSLTYMIGVVGTREYSLAVINDAEETINELVNGGIIVDEAAILLGYAWDAYRNEQYINAEEYAQQAKLKAVEIGLTASNALSSMDSVLAAIEIAEDVGRTSRLDEASAKLEQAQLAYDVGRYVDAVSLAEEALTYVQQSKAPSWFTAQKVIISVGLTIVVVILIAWRRMSRRPQEEIEIDIESIIKDYPLLRLEEKEVLRYIADTGEGIFLSELRDRFDLPRSTAWRMVRRLEEMGVLETEKIGRETFIRMSIARNEEEPHEPDRVELSEKKS